MSHKWCNLSPPSLALPLLWPQVPMMGGGGALAPSLARPRLNSALTHSLTLTHTLTRSVWHTPFAGPTLPAPPPPTHNRSLPRNGDQRANSPASLGKWGGGEGRCICEAPTFAVTRYWPDFGLGRASGMPVVHGSQRAWLVHLTLFIFMVSFPFLLHFLRSLSLSLCRLRSTCSAPPQFSELAAARNSLGF